MCKWYCTSEGILTNQQCLHCKARYCGACLHGEAGVMKSLIECAKCHKVPRVKSATEREGWREAPLPSLPGEVHASGVQQIAVVPQANELSTDRGATAKFAAGLRDSSPSPAKARAKSPTAKPSRTPSPSPKPTPAPAPSDVHLPLSRGEQGALSMGATGMGNTLADKYLAHRAKQKLAKAGKTPLLTPEESEAVALTGLTIDQIGAADSDSLAELLKECHLTGKNKILVQSAWKKCTALENPPPSATSAVPPSSPSSSPAASSAASSTPTSPPRPSPSSPSLPKPSSPAPAPEPEHKDPVAQVFTFYCQRAPASESIDNVKWSKLVKDLQLMDAKITTTFVDLTFTKAKPKGLRRLDLAGFRVAKYGNPDQIAQLLEHFQPPSTEPAKKKGDILDRMTDSSAYTGTHKHRFDEAGHGKGLEGRDRTGAAFHSKVPNAFVDPDAPAEVPRASPETTQTPTEAVPEGELFKPGQHAHQSTMNLFSGQMYLPESRQGTPATVDPNQAAGLESDKPDAANLLGQAPREPATSSPAAAPTRSEQAAGVQSQRDGGCRIEWCTAPRAAGSDFCAAHSR